MRLASGEDDRPRHGEHAGHALAPSLASPSLFDADAVGPAAFELKFLLTETQARAAEDRVQGRLALDPHADPALGGAYLTTSVYTDTPSFDVLRRIGEGARTKYRVRRYGPTGPVFVEQKAKTGDRVRKRRTPLPVGDSGPGADRDPLSDTAWFFRAVVERRLRPVCRVAYERVAYTGATADGVIRLTFDRRVRGCTTTEWAVDPVGDETDLLAGLVVCEFKFRAALPVLFKDLISDLGLIPRPVSKYRLFMTAAGYVDQEGTADA